MRATSLRRTLGAIESVAAGLHTWQALMRSSGPGAALQMGMSAMMVLTQLMRPLTRNVPMIPTPTSPEHLDLRARLGFVLNGLGTLGCLGSILPPLIRPGILARRNRKWRRDLARKGLWTRLTATERHSLPFTLAAAALAVLSGVGSYRSQAKNGGAGIFPGATIEVLGQVFPYLPFYGLARVSNASDRWLRLIAAPTAVATVALAIASLRSALMSEHDYQGLRRRWADAMQQRSDHTQDGEAGS